jgi:diguanylate cyclase (GGDEF)-like protein
MRFLRQDTAPGEQVHPRSSASTVVIVGLLIAVLYAAADRLMEDVLAIESKWGEVAEVAIMALLSSSLLWTAVLRPLHLQVARERRAGERRQAELALNAVHQEFETKLHRAMEMAATEDVVHTATRKALTIGFSGRDVELLLADSSDAHLKRAVVVNDAANSGCGVVAPHDCPAIRRSQTMQFDSSEALDACPHLENRPIGACSAVCVPVSVGGRSIGVLHAVAGLEDLPTAMQVRRLEAVANHAGSRLGMLRVMSATTLQAATDPLTGLLNRRSFENEAQAMLKRHRPFALAMGDLDQFKRLNDTHGHDGGDRALRLFARTVQGSLRDQDLVSRYGGEEFVIAFPDHTAADAAAALRRMQAELAREIGNGTVPHFTVSYGIAHSDQASSLEEICRIADAALFRAKREGRNRVVVDLAVADPRDDLEPTGDALTLV